MRPSRPRELHPEALTDPDVNLSIHPARATYKGCRLPSEPSSSSGCPLTLTIQMRVTCSLPSTAITPLHPYYRAVRPSLPHRYFQPRGSAACAFSLYRANQVLKFHNESPDQTHACSAPDTAWPVSRLLPCCSRSRAYAPVLVPPWFCFDALPTGSLSLVFLIPT